MGLDGLLADMGKIVENCLELAMALHIKRGEAFRLPPFV